MTVFLVTSAGVQTLTQDEGATIAILPGADIALHKVSIIATQPRERLDEARMLATDLAAQPIDDLHVVIGPPDTDGLSWLAIIDRELMQEHLAQLHAEGITPDHIIPAALTIPCETSVTLDGLTLVHEKEVAGAVAPEFAALLANPKRPAAQSYNPLPLAISVPLDLLQGSFAPRRTWWKEKGFRLQAGLLIAVLLLLIAAPYGLSQVRSSATTRELDQNVVTLAEQTLPEQAPFADAAQAATRLAITRRAHEAGEVGPRLSFLAHELSSVPGGRITLAERLPTGELRLVLGGSATAINTLSQRLDHGPFVLNSSGTAITLGERKENTPVGQSRQEIAAARLQQARQDAAIISTSQPYQPMPASELLDILTNAGLEDAELSASGEIQVPAAKATSLLPLILEIERVGAGFQTLHLHPNDDQTITAILVPRS